MVDIQRHQKGQRVFYTVDGDASVKDMELPNVTSIAGIVDGVGGLVEWAAKLAAESTVAFIERSMLDDSYSPLLDRFGLLLREAVRVGAQAPKVRREEAAGLGIAVHDSMDRLIKGNRLPIDDDPNLGIVNSLLSWQRVNNYKFTKSEVPVYSRRFKYAGTIDAIAVSLANEDNTAIIDFKVRGGIYQSTLLQMAAYYQAYIETYEGARPPLDPTPRVFVLRVDPESTVTEERLVSHAELDQGLTAFLLAKELREIQATLRTGRSTKTSWR